MEDFSGKAFKNRILDRIKPQKPSPWGLSIGLDHGLINRIFNEGKIPTAKHLLTISRALGVSVDWLLTGEEPVREEPAPSAGAPIYPPEVQSYVDRLVAILKQGGEPAGYLKGIIDLKYREGYECNESEASYAAENDASYKESKKGA